MLLVREELRRSATPGDHALSIGVFDGVHAGHRELMERLRAEAASRGIGTGVITFHPHPVTVVRPGVSFHYLESLERRVELIRQLGIDFVTVLPFTSELQQVSAADFVRILVEEVGMRALVVGEDFHLGRGREGDTARLAEVGREMGFDVVALPLVQDDGDRVSSTRIRAALARGDIEDVTVLLGRPFSLRGPVLHGDARGRQIGFPTINVGVSADRALPPDGVYVTVVEVDDARYQSVSNIGTQPTFGGTERRIEAHLLDFDGDLYGHVATLEFLHRLRDVRRFAGVDELVAAIHADVAATRAWFR